MVEDPQLRNLFYLWHLAINAYLVIRLPSLGEPAIAAIGAILSLSIAAASFRWVEFTILAG